MSELLIREVEDRILRDCIMQILQGDNLTKILGPAKKYFKSREDFEEYRQRLCIEILDAKPGARKRIIEVMRTEPKGIFHNYIFSLVRFVAYSYTRKRRELYAKTMPINYATDKARLKDGVWAINRHTTYRYNGENIIFSDARLTAHGRHKGGTDD